MHLSLISLALALFALLGAGTLVTRSRDSEAFGTIERLIIGFLVLSSFAMIANLFLPLGHAVVQFVMVLTVLLGARAASKRVITLSRVDQISYAVLFLGCAILGNRGWMHIDTGGYHNQMVKWLIETPIPFGLGNLQTRYAFNSIWHTFSAVLAFPGLGISGSYISGASLAFVLIAFMRKRLLNQPEARSFSQRAFIWATFSGVTVVHAGRRVIEGQIGSPSTDFPAAAFLLIFLMVCLDFEGDPHANEPLGFRRSIYLLSPLALAVATKLSVVPAALALLPLLRRISKSAVAASGAFLLLWIFRTFILSGCLIYPMVSSCFIPAKWAMPLPTVDGEYQALHIWGRVTPPPADPAIIQSWYRWIPLWSSQAFTEDLAIAWIRIVAVALIVGVVGFVFYRGQKSARPTKGLYAVGAASFLSLGFWFFQAPALRYGFGQIIATAAFVVAVVLVCTPRLSETLLSGRWLKRWTTLCFCFFSFQALYNAKGIKPRHFHEAWPRFPVVETIPVTTSAGSLISRPKVDGQCWNAPISDRCAPVPLSNLHEVVRWGRPEFRLE